MTSDLSGLSDLTATSSDLAILHQATIAFREGTGERPSASAVVDALLQAEKSAKRQRLTYPMEALLGQWQLCFATGTRKVRQRGGIVLGKGLYVPRFTPAQISFTQHPPTPEAPIPKLEAGNQIQLGPLLVKLTGPAQYLGKKNLLAFDFTHLQLSVFNRTLYQGGLRGGQQQAEAFYSQPIAKLPFFAFFAVTDELIAARGRGGGLALWVRSQSDL